MFSQSERHDHGTRICWDVLATTRSAGIEGFIFLDIQCVVNRELAFPHLFDFVSHSPRLGGGGLGFQNSPISGLRSPDTRRRL